MQVGGLLVLLESVLNPHKTRPFRFIFLDMVMLLQTLGVERSADEYKALQESEGFGDFQLQYQSKKLLHLSDILIRSNLPSTSEPRQVISQTVCDICCKNNCICHIRRVI